ncbi:MAG: FliI/YscN family ATPase [Myxococcaceae bacterium]|nr:FliI/YscN family ATPase [Myxococcaceae bacterium]
MHHLEQILEQIRLIQPFRMRGKVLESTQLMIKASVPNSRVGDLCYVTTQNEEAPLIRTEVVGFQEGIVYLMPLGDLEGIGPDSEVIPTGKPFSIKCGYGLLGRVLNGLGESMDDGVPISQLEDLVDWSVHRESPNPYTRQPIDKPISMGIRAIDGLLTVGRGQRIGLFAGSGVGKSTLMGQMARNTEAEIVVACLVGERGREVLDFIHESLGEEGLKRTVLIAAASDTPPLVRLKSCYVATAIAEWFREQGKDVLFMMDSATRFARAQREIGLALGEPPARQGFPPSVFALIPRLMERMGNNDKGSVTAIYTVLVQAGDMEEPIADEVRGILDGHIVLNRALGERNHWPAIDILPSLSRVMMNITGSEHQKAANYLRETMANYEKNRDLILLGAYNYGTDPKVDYAIDKNDAVERFLKQNMHENSPFETTVSQLQELFSDAGDLA